MMAAQHEGGVMDRECAVEKVPLPVALREEIAFAARHDATVLITGSPEAGKEIACALDRESQAPRGVVEIVDCTQPGAFTRVTSIAATGGGETGPQTSRVLLLQEIHALAISDQVELDDRLTRLRLSGRAASIRVVASSSSSLFELVQNRCFDEQLFYHLNVIHLVVL